MARAAIYARISKDDGTALGVTRQADDCRKVIADLGWDVADEYIDNDVSAYSGKKRPAYERMLADIGDGRIDALVCYHADRLTRRPIELEHLLDVLGKAGIRNVRFVAGGDLDIANGDGLMVLRLLSAVAANESATKSRRQKRKNDENAAAGRPHGGSIRPFGFEDDRITHRPEEAAVVRTMVARYLAGDSLRSLTTWLQEDQPVPAVSGKPWNTTTVRGILLSPRIAGLRVHRKEAAGPGNWKPIISEADHARLLARLKERSNSGKRTARTYLLSGLLRCEGCGHKLYSEARETTRRYVCRKGPDFGGCGKRTIVAEPVEELVTAAVLFRLDSPELADALTGRAAEDEQTAALSEALAQDRVLREELAQLYAARQINAQEWLSARNPIEARIADTERRLARRTRSDALTGWVGNADELRTTWQTLNLDRRAAIVGAIVDHGLIGPGTPGARTLDPARVEIIWKL